MINFIFRVDISIINFNSICFFSIKTIIWLFFFFYFLRPSCYPFSVVISATAYNLSIPSFYEQKIRYLIFSISDNGHTRIVISRIRDFRWYMGSYMSYQYLTQHSSIKMVGFTRQTRRHWFFVKKIGPIKIEHFLF